MHFEMIGGVVAQGLQHAICQNTFGSTKQQAIIEM
jgi:hypothetical protein